MPPWQRLYFFFDPHGQRSLRPIFCVLIGIIFLATRVKSQKISPRRLCRVVGKAKGPATADLSNLNSFVFVLELLLI